MENHSQLSPVEALQREAEHVRGFAEDDRDIIVDPRMMQIFLSALELAKADAEYDEFIGTPEMEKLNFFISRTHVRTDESLVDALIVAIKNEGNRLYTARQRARAKLYKALQR